LGRRLPESRFGEWRPIETLSHNRERCYVTQE
jgi:hypothetical protein